MIKNLNSILLLLLLSLQAEGQQPEASEILSRSRELTLTGNLIATVDLSITEKNGSVRNRSVSILSKSYPDGSEKRLLKFLEPADVRGTSMLIYDNKTTADEMWIYLPALKKSRRIVSSEKGRSFMSSEFTNADMSSPPLADFDSRHLKGSGESNQWIIESVPVNDSRAEEYGFSRKVTYLSADKYVVKGMEYYDFENKLFKKMEVKAVHPGNDGKYIISDMKATNFSNGRSSEIRFRGITTDQDIDDSRFSIQSLEK